jgi:hypothetical protein
VSDPIFQVGKCGLPWLRSILRDVLVVDCRVPPPPPPIRECDTRALVVQPVPDGNYIALTYPHGIPGRVGATLGHAPVKIMHLKFKAQIPGQPPVDPKATQLVDSGTDLEAHNADVDHVGGDEYILVQTYNGVPITGTEYCLGHASTGGLPGSVDCGGSHPGSGGA